MSGINAETIGRESPLVEKSIYWHRELPPLDASTHVEGTLAHQTELWDRCHQDLMSQTSARLEQEMARLGGRYAHVLDESIDTKRDDVKGEAWLHGRFKYVLYR